MYIKQQYDKIKIDNSKEFTLQGSETIVENINRLIVYIQNNKVLATKINRHFAIKQIEELNSILVNPLKIISARPQQKSYPNLNGLYLILRTMGILTFAVSKKEIVMGIDEKLLKNWKTLNITEQYFMLLEFWLIHSKPKDTLSIHSNISPLAEIVNFFAENSCATIEITIEMIPFQPEFYNIALCEMFGFINVIDAEPTKKNRWNIIDIKVLPFAKKVLSLILQDKKNMLKFIFSSQERGYYQKTFAPYFKEFKNILKYPKEVTHNGVFTLKVTLGKAYRTIKIDSKESFETLALAILEEFNFDNDHLFEFGFMDRFGTQILVKHFEMDLNDTEFCVDNFYLSNLPLRELESFVFIFDFGDWWKFDIFIEKIEEGESIEGVKLLKSYGVAPEQYPYYED